MFLVNLHLTHQNVDLLFQLFDDSNYTHILIYVQKSFPHLDKEVIVTSSKQNLEELKSDSKVRTEEIPRGLKVGKLFSN